MGVAYSHNPFFYRWKNQMPRGFPRNFPSWQKPKVVATTVGNSQGDVPQGSSTRNHRGVGCQVFCVVVYLRGVSTNTQKSETEGRSYGLKILLFLVGIILMGRWCDMSTINVKEAGLVAVAFACAWIPRTCLEHLQFPGHSILLGENYPALVAFPHCWNLKTSCQRRHDDSWNRHRP